MIRMNRRDLLVGILAAFLTASVLASIGWTAVQRQRERAESARDMARVAEQQAADAHNQAQRNLVDQAANVLMNLEGRDKAELEALQVTTAAVAPEIPQGAQVLIDKKASSYAAGDIVIYQLDGNNYLARVIAVDKAAGRLTVGRNGQENREVAASAVTGRAVLNTR
jgi:hypothetical protein